MLSLVFRHRLIQLFAAVLLFALAFSASTAYACGCGIYIPNEGSAEVAQERALVRWDGQREDILMSLGVLGGSKEAAIILPIPSQAEVKLGDKTLFAELDELTKPLVREETEWVLGVRDGVGAPAPRAMAGGAPPVAVLSRQNIGPFDVANLAATDANALKNWLDDNGFQLDPAISEVLQPYVDKGWTFVAVRLQPEQATGELGGELAPLWIAFDSNELVYPMRASAHAANAQSLDLYLLAAHRVNKENAFGASRVSYADWVEPSALTAGSPLAALVTEKLFLTKYIDTVNPSEVDDDFHFAFAPQDTTFREVRVVRVQKDASSLVLLACLSILALGAGGFVVLVVLLARRRATPVWNEQ